MTRIKDALLRGTDVLGDTSQSARLDAEMLLAHLLNCRRLDLIARQNDELEEEMERQFSALLNRRKRSEPVAYITGIKEFYALEFEVSPAVLIPRPETEHLVEAAVEYLSTEQKSDLRILDFGTGSGCVAAALCSELRKAGRDFLIDALDVSEAALQVAKRNFRKFGMEGKVRTILSDGFSALSMPGEGSLPARYDLIVSNPPYVRKDAEDVSPEISYEPPTALFAGSDGLDSVRYLLSEAPRYLKKEGALIIEVGSDQSSSIKSLASGVFKKDLAGRDRIFIYRINAS